MERLSFFATRTEEEAMRETHNEPHSVRPGIADSTSLCFCKGEDNIANDDNSIVFQGKVIRGITAKEREFIKQNAGGNIWQYKGSISAVEFKKLVLTKDTVGYVYNVVDPVEVYGVLYPAYTNFVCINAGTDDEPTYKWDSFGGTYPEATDTVPGIISKDQVRGCIPVATLENNGLLSKEEFATFMNKLDAADLLPYATKEEALPKKEASARYLLPVHMDIDNLPNMTESKQVIGNRIVVDVDTSKLDVATITVTSPCYAYFYILGYNADQTPDVTPVPYVLRYEVSCDKYNNGEYYSDGASVKKTGGCYACILFEITDEMIQEEGGSIVLNFYARSSVYPSIPINRFGQNLKVSLEIFNKYEYVKTQEYLEEHYYDKETADTKFIKVEERPSFATKDYIIKSYEENSTIYNNRSTANMLLVHNNKNLRNKHISEFGWRVDSDVAIPEGEFYLCAMEEDSRIIGYSKEKRDLRNFINKNILFTFEEDIIFSEDATVKGFALIAEKVADNIYPIPVEDYPNMRPSIITGITEDKNFCMLVVNGTWKRTQMATYHVKYYEYIKDIVNDGRIFIAEYGASTYNEIKKAFDDGYNVICKKDNTFYNLLNVSSVTISFSTSDETQLNNVSVNSNNVWIYNTISVENKNNKVTNIDASSDDTQYPSAKAVYTQINNNISKIITVLGDYAKTNWVIQNYQPRGNYATTTDLEEKQETLVSGTNIKTVNGKNILGSGDLEIDINDKRRYQLNRARLDAEYAEVVAASHDIAVRQITSSSGNKIKEIGDNFNAISSPTLQSGDTVQLLSTGNLKEYARITSGSGTSKSLGALDRLFSSSVNLFNSNYSTLVNNLTEIDYCDFQLARSICSTFESSKIKRINHILPTKYCLGATGLFYGNEDTQSTNTNLVWFAGMDCSALQESYNARPGWSGNWHPLVGMFGDKYTNENYYCSQLRNLPIFRNLNLSIDTMSMSTNNRSGFAELKHIFKVIGGDTYQPVEDIDKQIIDFMDSLGVGQYYMRNIPDSSAGSIGQRAVIAFHTDVFNKINERMQANDEVHSAIKYAMETKNWVFTNHTMNPSYNDYLHP